VPWTCVSVCEKQEGGGVIQLWRMSDLLYRPEAEVLAELEKHRESITAATANAAGGGDDEPMGDA
jgi:histone-binding protein RBBP4